MIYILDTDILTTKSIFFSLKKVHGLGTQKTNFVCKNLGLSPNLKTSKVPSWKLKKLAKLPENFQIKITNELKKELSLNFKNSISIKSYKGLRKLKGLPVRGQRTHTNSKTAKRLRFAR